MLLAKVAAVDQHGDRLAHGALNASRARATVRDFESNATQLRAQPWLTVDCIITNGCGDGRRRFFGNVVVQGLRLDARPSCNEIELRPED
jgi:hypothetical protein